MAIEMEQLRQDLEHFVIGLVLPLVQELGQIQEGPVAVEGDHVVRPAVVVGPLEDLGQSLEGWRAQHIQLLGFTGTAHALLQGGVPSVVAMRYAVGDELPFPAPVVVELLA